MRKNPANSFLRFLVNPMILITLACSQEKVAPVPPKPPEADVTMADISVLVPPVWKNATAAGPLKLLQEKAEDVFEVLEWESAKYNISSPQLSVAYFVVLEGNGKRVWLPATTPNSLTLSVNELNRAMLESGLPTFEESIVNFFVVSSTNGAFGTVDGWSQPIQRTATTYVPRSHREFYTIGLFGDATAGGWLADIDMTPRADNTSEWSAIAFLTGGKHLRFRAGDDDTKSWGGTGFTQGTAIKNGPAITVLADGYYEVNFNDQTGAYFFKQVAAPEFASISTTVNWIGDYEGMSKDDGFAACVSLTRSPRNPHVWTGYTPHMLESGDIWDGDELRFLANCSWERYWSINGYYRSGYISFPSGTVIDNSGCVGCYSEGIVTEQGGKFFVRFHDVTGEYALMTPESSKPYSSMRITGSAQGHANMIRNPSNPYLWSAVVNVTDDGIRFVAGDNSSISWGATSFPGGIAERNGSSIPLRGGPGVYFVTFHSGTGEYYFLR